MLLCAFNLIFFLEISVPVYTSPEVLISGPGLDQGHIDVTQQGQDRDEDEDPMDVAHRRVSAGGGKGDVWSLGVILLQTALVSQAMERGSLALGNKLVEFFLDCFCPF